ncbi:hypothetical protein O6H91_09G019900 [Diphasiastrum complanatum]|nr:hypothetical protein O6H91_09G019900 [Diphasiastrum complanatum]
MHLPIINASDWPHQVGVLIPTRNNLLGVNTSFNEQLSDQQSIPPVEGVVKGMALVFGGWTMLSCLFWAPRLQLKRKEEEKEVSSRTMSLASTSISSGRSYVSCSSSAFSTNLSAQGSLSECGALAFTMGELSKVTGNFSPSHKIGQGGFGAVYKGKLRNGTFVAIKRARKNAADARLSAEFKAEVQMLSRIEHLNLVKLIGYLEEVGERILVFEYVPNGNLREHLDAQFGVVLDLGTRLDILIDVAHALTYLHLYADEPIIHRDVKSSNILLTDNFRAKVADFGFSKAGPSEMGVTHVSTQVKGTAGYLDPEYLLSYQVTLKSDVYSFGVLMVEVLTGRRPIELRREGDERVTIRWAFKKFREGQIVHTVDTRLEISSESYITIGRMAELAFRCAAPTRNERPTMKEAAEILCNIRKDYQSWLLERNYKERRRSSKSFQSGGSDSRS